MSGQCQTVGQWRRRKGAETAAEKVRLCAAGRSVKADENMKAVTAPLLPPGLARVSSSPSRAGQPVTGPILGLLALGLAVAAVVVRQSARAHDLGEQAKVTAQQMVVGGKVVDPAVAHQEAPPALGGYQAVDMCNGVPRTVHKGFESAAGDSIATMDEQYDAVQAILSSDEILAKTRAETNVPNAAWRRTINRMNSGESVRLLVLGGSETSGVQCDEGEFGLHRTARACAWANRLQDWLTAAFPAANITVTNMARGGTTTAVMLAALGVVLHDVPDYEMVLTGKPLHCRLHSVRF
eukprot:SAG11_NODE_7419_length_1147_cov_1.032443_1_plen_294_part_10